MKRLIATLAASAALLAPLAASAAGPKVPAGFCDGKRADGTPYELFIVQKAAHTWHADAWLFAIRMGQKALCGRATF
jgi:hypothetical protein